MNILKQIMIGGLLALTVGGLAACKNRGDDSASQAMQDAGTAVNDAGKAVGNAASEMGDDMSDAAVTSKVKAAILGDPELKVMQISVATRDGVVTLTGEVDSQDASDQAEAVAKRVDGVKQVDNQLSVAPKA